MGPDPMAKYFPTATCQPAYCDAMHASTGSSVATPTIGQYSASASLDWLRTLARSATQTRAIARPALNPPGALTPQSSTRAPAVRSSATPRTAASAARSFATRRARVLRDSDSDMAESPSDL